MRVVSLLPSATELLRAIGGQPLLVGRSHECDYPPAIAELPVLTAPRITATTSPAIDQQVRTALEEEHAASLYTIDTDLLQQLQPDVILTQDLCDVCSIDLDTVQHIAQTIQPQPQIVSFNPRTIDDMFDDMLRVGEAVGLADQARDAMIALRERYWVAREYVNAYVPGPEIAVLEWMDPLFIAGHWTPQLVHDAGGVHSLNEPGAKSRQISPEDLLQAMPQKLIICPCGYDLKAIKQELPAMRQQRWWPLIPAVQDAQVAIVDGSQMLSRPGPRLIDALYWLVGWINDRPELIPPDFPAEMLAA